MPLMALPRRSPLAAAVLGTLSAVASAAAPVATVAAELPAARAVAAGATAALNESGNKEALVAILEQLDFDRAALDEAFVTLCGVLVFLMQTGFCMLTAGYVWRDGGGAMGGGGERGARACALWGASLPAGRVWRTN